METGNTIVVKPKVIDDVLTNPGIGFMTFQRFNGDTLNEGKVWTEGFPINYQEFHGDLEIDGYPNTSIAYFRVYWRYLEPKKSEYRWDLIDNALKTARNRKQTLMLRVAPSGTTEESDVPDWYKGMTESKVKLPESKWAVDPEDPQYAEHFGSFIRAMGKRYDAHPDLESVDLSILSAWGEGAGSYRLTQKTREALGDAYVESFKQTPLIALLTDPKTNGYALSKADVGWRVDCLGDMKSPLGEKHPPWSHMLDYYPQQIILSGVKDAWKKAPVSMEVCWVIQHWKDMGWDVDYIIDQSLKWHISSFNAKSSAVPEDWWPNINRWLNKMGYRLALRNFSFPDVIKPGEKLSFTSWWENLGVAPCYKNFALALRLKGNDHNEILVTSADIKQWLPGDSLFDSYVVIPSDMPLGKYELQIGIIDPITSEPVVKLAIEGREPDGWYALGQTIVQTKLNPPLTPHEVPFEPPW